MLRTYVMIQNEKLYIIATASPSNKEQRIEDTENKVVLYVWLQIYAQSMCQS